MSQDHSLWADSVTIAEIAQLRKDLAEREAQLHTAQRLLEIEQSIRGYADAAVKIESLEQQLSVANHNETVANETVCELTKRLKDADSKQAKIDSLMIEYCPEDMTDAQIGVYCVALKEEETPSLIDGIY